MKEIRTNPRKAQLQRQVAADLSTYFSKGPQAITAGVALISHAKSGYLAAAPVLAAPEAEGISRLLADLAGGWTGSPGFDQRLFFDMLRLVADGSLTVNGAAFAAAA